MPGRTWYFVADLHGRVDRYGKLFDRVAAERPSVLLLGGDLLPHGLQEPSGAAGGTPEGPAEGAPSAPGRAADDFVARVLVNGFRDLRRRLGSSAPRVGLILGNDDPRAEEPSILEAGDVGLWAYLHGRRVEWDRFVVHGYACVPPTPFALKDWERYDVSRYVDPGCVAPEDGWHSVPFDERAIRHATILDELGRLVAADDQARAVWLLHAPPYDTPLDRAALDGRSVEHVPLDVHVGSIAVRRLIEARQPWLTLHGHVHESARLTGAWKTRLGRTWCLSAAHDGPELALVRLDPEVPGDAERLLL